MRLDKLAESLGCRWEGDGNCDIQGIASLDSAGPGDLSFVTDARRAREATHSRAGALLVEENFDSQTGRTLLRTPQPALALARAVELLRPALRPQPGVDTTARVHATAQLGPDCYIGPFAVISEHCHIGAGAVIHAHAVLYPHVRAGARLVAHAHVVVREGTVLGDDVVLQPGVVLGGDGFGFAADGKGGHMKIPQVGIVVIGDRVEVQANSCVDRASLEATRIGAGTKVDNLTQIAHNCQIGENVLLCAQVGLAGSTRVGDGAVLAGQAGVAGHCTVGAGAIITAQSGTHGDLEGGRMYSGSPAFDHAQWLRASAAFTRLGEMQRELRALRTEVRALRAGKA